MHDCFFFLWYRFSCDELYQQEQQSSSIQCRNWEQVHDPQIGTDQNDKIYDIQQYDKESSGLFGFIHGGIHHVCHADHAGYLIDCYLTSDQLF